MVEYYGTPIEQQPDPKTGLTPIEEQVQKNRRLAEALDTMAKTIRPESLHSSTSSRPLSATAAILLAMDGPRRSDLHDCRMTFPFPRAFPMAWLFVCDCGYETMDQHEALAHGQRPPPPPHPEADQ